MSLDPVSVFRERFVSLFNRGAEILEQRAAAGDPRDIAAADDVRNASGVSVVTFEGAGDVWVVLESGRLRAVDTRPLGVPVRVVATLPADVARLWLAEIEKRPESRSDEAAVRTARSASRRVQDAIGDVPLDFHFILKDTPDFDEVVVRVAIHRDSLPDRPSFTATVRWDDLETVRGSGQTLPQLMMAGKLKLGGDYSRALKLAMELQKARGR